MSEFGGRMLFSGANYRRDHQVKVNPPLSEIGYLTRDDPKNPCKKYRKNESAGEIGWAVENLCPEEQQKPTNIDGKFFGFTKGIFRRAADLRASHRHQSPYSEPLKTTKLPSPLNNTKPRITNATNASP
ncbi:unnamed protein product [Oikopleura dioica]|uniref:Uncharacterized protein n=1 Tax=Oikopleura dioica TaxID=34765 RepID=E4X4J3_OIKDI|nr:unnamed protein product [Oikopleura dioica]